jgi:uncharacterized membrane protein
VVAIIWEMLLCGCSVGSIMYSNQEMFLWNRSMAAQLFCDAQQLRNVSVKSLSALTAVFYSAHWRSEDGLDMGKLLVLVSCTPLFGMRMWLLVGVCVNRSGSAGTAVCRAYCCKLPNIRAHARQKIPLTACNEMPCAVCKHGGVACFVWVSQ